MRTNRLLVCLAITAILNSGKCFAQDKIYTPVFINEAPKTDFAFTKKWDYAWYITVEKNGKLGKSTPGKITKEDKAHLYFTANCKTNVQGGYNIRYCYAKKLPDTAIVIDFRDGEPAYFNSFKLLIKNGKFCFEPNILTPVFAVDQEVAYKISRQNLTLNQKIDRRSKLISGYIDIAFSQIITRDGKSEESTLYYLRGYFKTPVN